MATLVIDKDFREERIRAGVERIIDQSKIEKYKDEVELNFIITLDDLIVDSPTVLFDRVNFSNQHIKIQFAGKLFNNENEVKIEFRSCTNNNFQNEFIIEGQEGDGNIELEFRSCELQDLNLENGVFNKVSFYETVFANSLTIEFDTKIIEKISFSNTLGNIYLNEGEIEKFEYIITRRINRISLNRSVPEVSNIEIGNCKNISFLSSSLYSIVSNNDPDKVALEDNNLNLPTINVSLNGYRKECGNLYISDFICNSLRIFSLKADKVEIRRLKTNNLLFHNLKSRELIVEEFFTEGKSSFFSLENCSCEVVRIQNSIFNDESVLNFYQTAVDNFQFFNVQLPRNLHSKRISPQRDNSGNDSNPENLYELYRQLKISAQKTDSILLIQQFHKKMYQTLEKLPNLNCEEKLILRLNRISNNHNTSVKNAVAIFFGSSVLIAYFIFSIQYDFRLCTFMAQFPKYSDTVISLLNVGRKIEPNQPFVSLLTLISKVINLWAIYQFVTAFRRFGSKS